MKGKFSSRWSYSRDLLRDACVLVGWVVTKMHGFSSRESISTLGADGDGDGVSGQRRELYAA